jgi:hypothetical protein
MDNSGFESGQGQVIFLYTVQTDSPPYSTCIGVFLVPGAKHPGCVAVCSLLSRAEVKNEWITTSALPLPSSYAQRQHSLLLEPPLSDGIRIRTGLLSGFYPRP